MKKVAIFDIDGTIFRSSLLIELVEVLIEKNLFPQKAARTFAGKKKLWLDRRGDYESYIEAVVVAFMEHIKGVHYSDFDAAAELVIERYKNRVYRFTRDMLVELKRKKYFLLAISQSPKRILDEFCADLGFDKVYGRFYELGPTDRFTGKVQDEHLIGNKANIVKRAVEREGLTLKGSVGVGDTEGDISFLEMVDHPVCFNPNARLYKYARRNGWRVVVERKDVVYEIK